MRRTPDNDVAGYDQYPPEEAALLAWTRPGPNPDYHERCRDQVRALMPRLGRALDRLEAQDADADPRRATRPPVCSVSLCFHAPRWERVESGEPYEVYCQHHALEYGIAGLSPIPGAKP